jgi:23S rRNA (cytosine1962-C5)-methyltransferase
MNNINTNEYQLIDTGDGEKLERFGKYVLRRPDPEVLWRKTKSDEDWSRADGYFKKDGKSYKWFFKEDIISSWQIVFSGLTLNLKIGNFKHIGLFPEQVSNWSWMESIISKAKEKDQKKQIRILNLFGYTGTASLYLAGFGCDVTHIDSSKPSIEVAKNNQELSGLKEKNIRFILDDVRKFVEREIKRGARYDGILMDPPVYGKGSVGAKNKNHWDIHKDFLPLVELVKKLLSDKPLFVCVSGYASEFSHLSYKNALLGVFKNTKVESGELALKESDTERLLPAGIYARIEF